MKKAFSLIELLISLIIISIITAAFSPILIKKLKRSNIIGAPSGAITKCDKINTNCKLCIKDTCIKCELNCSSNQYKDTGSCICKNCNTFNAACLSCNSTGCLRCKAGYGLNNGSCTACAAGWASDGTTVCKICPKGNYSNSDKSACLPCTDGQYQDAQGATSCKPCSGKVIANGSVCSIEAPCNGYKDSNGVCRSCPSGQYFHLNTCLKCSLYDPSCINCNSDGCISCKEGYHLEDNKCIKNLSWQPPSSQEDCDPYNAVYIAAGANICVTKFNAGDPGGPPLTIDSAKIHQGNGTVATNCAGDCCWSGGFTSGHPLKKLDNDNYFSYGNSYCSTLASKINGNSKSNYGGCTRTVCQYYAAEKSCNEYKVKLNEEQWHLPDYKELQAIQAQYYEKSHGQGKNGLQLCENKLCFYEESKFDTGADGASPPSNCRNGYAAKCIPLYFGCNNGNPTDMYNNCTPATIWGQGLSSLGVRGVAQSTNYSITEFVLRSSGEANLANAARSVRCVLKKVYK